MGHLIFLSGLMFCFMGYSVSGVEVRYPKVGERTLIDVPRPPDSAVLQGCSARLNVKSGKATELGDLMESGKTSGHFISTDSCSLELVTNTDYGIWEITTTWVDRRGVRGSRNHEVQLVPPVQDVRAGGLPKTVLAASGKSVRISVNEPELGKKVKCFAVYTSDRGVKTEYSISTPGMVDYSLTPIFELDFGSSCSLTMTVDNNTFGTWDFITSYRYMDDSTRYITKNQSDRVLIKDTNLFESHRRPERVVSPDFEFTVKRGKTQTIEAVVGKSRTMTPSPIDAKYIERCEAVYVGSKEDFIFEISPVKDTRFDFNKRNVYSTCEFEFIRFQRSYYGKWIISSYFKKPEGRKGKMFRQDDHITVRESVGRSK